MIDVLTTTYRGIPRLCGHGVGHKHQGSEKHRDIYPVMISLRFSSGWVVLPAHEEAHPKLSVLDIPGSLRSRELKLRTATIPELIR